MVLELKSIVIEDFARRTDIFSKNIRGNFNFTVETHVLDNNKNIQLYFFRDEQDIKSLIEDWKNLDEIKESKATIHGDYKLIRIKINDKELMFDNQGLLEIQVREYNYNPAIEKDIKKGKVAVLIDIKFSEENNNLKIKSDIKRLFEEENQ